MICPSCQTMIGANERVCPYCGSKIIHPSLVQPKVEIFPMIKLTNTKGMFFY